MHINLRSARVAVTLAGGDDPEVPSTPLLFCYPIVNAKRPMPKLYPLRFEPILKRAIWGGRRLESVLGKKLGTGHDFAESWEIVDHGADQSRVSAGSLAGRTLNELIHEMPQEMLGRHADSGPFPLLLKFLDANRNLSVQVHPNDAQAGLLTPPDLGKTEAWIVLAAEPESVIYAGLKTGIDREALSAAIAAGTTDECLHQIHPKPGDCVFVPAGTVHALAAGVLVAEIQQSSDTTFRLFDWNRLGQDGQPRPLHIGQALDVIDFDAGPLSPQQPKPTNDPQRQQIVKCNQFILDRWQLDSPQQIGGDERFHILAVLEGTVRLSGDPCEQPLKKGDSVLLPAQSASTEVAPLENATILDSYLP